MKVLAAAFAAFILLSPARAQDGGASDHWDARITAVTGDVVVHPAGGGDDVPGAADMPLEEGDRITTAADSTAEISLDGDSLISLTENSDFTLKNTQKSASIFSLTLGSLMAKIQKLGSQSMSIQSPSSVAAVRGTEFAVDIEGDQSHVGVFDEGRVEVQGGSGEMQVLTPNEETSVELGHAPMRAEPLHRFLGRREAMRAHILRLAAIHRGWRPIPAGMRRAARARAFEHARQRRASGRGRSYRNAPEHRDAPSRRGSPARHDEHSTGHKTPSRDHRKHEPEHQEHHEEGEHR